MIPSKIFLIDRSQVLVDRWKEQFSDCPEVEAIAGDYFQRPADAIVSPANSFGIMDGGLDLAIRDQLGFQVQDTIQKVIVEKHHGELPVGCAEIIETNDSRWYYMIAAPTMRVPEPISFTINAYLAFRALLVAVEKFNGDLGKREVTVHRFVSTRRRGNESILLSDSAVGTSERSFPDPSDTPPQTNGVVSRAPANLAVGRRAQPWR